MLVLLINWLIEKRLKNGPFQRLLFDQALANHNQALLILCQDRVSLLKSGLNNRADLFIDLARGLLTIVSLLAEIASQKDQFLFVPQRHWSDLTAHPVFRDHRASDLGDALDII